MTKEIQETAITLKDSAGRMLTTADTMMVSSDEINKTDDVSKEIEKVVMDVQISAGAADETNNNINIIATAVEEMTATVRHGLGLRGDFGRCRASE